MNWLGKISVGLLGGLLVATVACAKEASSSRLSPKEIREPVRATVESQVKAVRAGDFKQAFDLASEGIRRQFSLPVFAAMIRRGYPELLWYEKFELSLVQDDREGTAWVVVTLKGRADQIASYRYVLTQEGSEWRVEGVLPERPRPSESF